MQALGLIETRGLIAAIESADAMLKAAEVRLVERTFVKAVSSPLRSQEMLRRAGLPWMRRRLRLPEWEERFFPHM